MIIKLIDAGFIVNDKLVSNQLVKKYGFVRQDDFKAVGRLKIK